MDGKYLKNPIQRRSKTRDRVGDDHVQQDKYYAYLRHRAQARFRSEPYELTWEQWDRAWTPELWAQRGRSVDSYCIIRINPRLSWNESNIAIITRREQLSTRWGRIHG